VSPTYVVAPRPEVAEANPFASHLPHQVRDQVRVRPRGRRRWNNRAATNDVC
jgi:hypothetical protein